MVDMSENGKQLQAVSADEVLPVAVLRERFGWQKHMLREARKKGLKVVRIGRADYTTGRWVLEFVERLGMEGEKK